MHKDSKGHIGFITKKGKVVSVVKGSSAARNGLVTNHYMCEVNGQNVIGLKVSGGQLHLGTLGVGGSWVRGGSLSAGRRLSPSEPLFPHPKVAARIQ